ncbi:MAG: hypothetical protein GX268_10460 [Methanomicrobiales archaeon]|nr:hypothetical protein [Methanomicrobiales archaeon]
MITKIFSHQGDTSINTREEIYSINILQGITGGVLHLERDAVEAADAMLAHIMINRKKLKI